MERLVCLCCSSSNVDLRSGYHVIPDVLSRHIKVGFVWSRTARGNLNENEDGRASLKDAYHIGNRAVRAALW